MNAHFISFGAFGVVYVVIPSIIWDFFSSEIRSCRYDSANVNVVVECHVHTLGYMHNLRQELGLEGVKNSREVFGVLVWCKFFSWHVIFTCWIPNHSCTYKHNSVSTASHIDLDRYSEFK